MVLRVGLKYGTAALKAAVKGFLKMQDQLHKK